MELRPSYMLICELSPGPTLHSLYLITLCLIFKPSIWPRSKPLSYRQEVYSTPSSQAPSSLPSSSHCSFSMSLNSLRHRATTMKGMNEWKHRKPELALEEYYIRVRLFGMIWGALSRLPTPVQNCPPFPHTHAAVAESGISLTEMDPIARDSSSFPHKAWKQAIVQFPATSSSIQVKRSCAHWHKYEDIHGSIFHMRKTQLWQHPNCLNNLTGRDNSAIMKLCQVK